MRIAWVDLLFSWPGNGGADVDAYHVLQGLQQAGHRVKLIGIHTQGSAERGRFDPAALPFPAERLDHARLDAAQVTERVRASVDAYAPDLVFLGHGFALKPLLAQALAHHRLVARYYAHEFGCLKDALRYRDGAPCPRHVLETPEFCRRCALPAQRPFLTRESRSWTEELLAARAFYPAYPATLRAGLDACAAVIVSNARLRAEMAQWHPRVRVVPGGVSPGVPAAPTTEAPRDHVVFMAGRVDDPLKGLEVLLAAGAQVRSKRSDFQVRATHYDVTLSKDWFRATGWLSHAETLAQYAEADVVVVPSVWEEPFGLVAVEAMRAGRPVIASDTGGLRDIVADGETGFLVPPGDVAALAARLGHLLDDAGLRARMGAAGAARVAERFTWDTIIARHYTPLLEELSACPVNRA